METFNFNFDLLDKKNTYVGLQYGVGLISKKIVKYSKQYAPNSAEIPSHVFGLKYRYGSWWVFESHMTGHKKLNIPDGVRRTKLETWLKIEDLNKYSIYPLKLSVKKLEDYIGQSYGMGDIKSLMLASIFHSNGKQKDRNGLICSEYISLCNDVICKYYNLPAWCITPAHYQNYFDTLDIKGIGE